MILPSKLQDVVAHQFAAIQASHDRIRSLRELTAPPPPTAEPVGKL
jgi:hypothetical protein